MMNKIKIKKKEKSMSLIALVITIIVIILSTIAFNGSTSTICKANYAKFISNLNDVEEAI